MALHDSPWKNGAKRAYALSGPIPEYWPMYSSEKKMGRAITSTIITKGMRNAPGKGDNILLFNLQEEVGRGFIKICQILPPFFFRRETYVLQRRSPNDHQQQEVVVEDGDGSRCDYVDGHCL